MHASHPRMTLMGRSPIRTADSIKAPAMLPEMDVGNTRYNVLICSAWISACSVASDSGFVGLFLRRKFMRALRAHGSGSRGLQNSDLAQLQPQFSDRNHRL